jgi:hypothetical protein
MESVRDLRTHSSSCAQFFRPYLRPEFSRKARCGVDEVVLLVALWVKSARVAIVATVTEMCGGLYGNVCKL